MLGFSFIPGGECKECLAPRNKKMIRHWHKAFETIWEGVVYTSHISYFLLANWIEGGSWKLYP